MRDERMADKYSDHEVENAVILLGGSGWGGGPLSSPPSLSARVINFFARQSVQKFACGTNPTCKHKALTTPSCLFEGLGSLSPAYQIAGSVVSG